MSKATETSRDIRLWVCILLGVSYTAYTLFPSVKRRVDNFVRKLMRED